MMKRFVLLFVSVAVVAILLPASSGASTPTTASPAAAIGQALEAGSGTTSTGAHSSRWKRPKKMTFATAKAQAWSNARYIYLSPEFTFDDYGAGSCYRANRIKVRCYTWVSEDVYDDYGYYYDTELCDWFTVSYYSWNGRLGVWTSPPDCVWLSEV